MKNKIKITFLSFIIIPFFSCEEEVAIDIDEEEQKLVLNTWLKPDENPEVQVSYSSFIFDKTGEGFLNNAKVVMLENGSEIGELNHYEDGFYANENIILTEGTDYQFEVSHADYKTVFSKERIPTKIKDDEVEISYEINPNGNHSNYSYVSTINFRIRDNPEEENYYLARIAQIETYWNAREEDTTTYKNYIYMEPIDPQTRDTFLPNSGGHFVLSDDIFNGKEYEMKLGAFNDLRSYEYQEDSAFYQSVYHEIEFHKINRALYLYLISIDNNQYPGPFTEPTQMYSNVENGYGIVGTSSFTKYVIEETNDNQY